MNLREISLAVVFVSVFAVSFLMPLRANAQEGTNERSLAECQLAWKALAEKFDKLEKQITAEEDSETAEIEFKKAVANAKKLVAELESAAKKALDADRTSSDALRALMGLAVESAANDEDLKVLELGDYLISKGISPKYFEFAAKSEKLSIKQKQIFDELLIRQSEAIKNDLPRVELVTTKGSVVLELFENEAPGTVGNFVNLVEKKYLDGLLFHRVMEGFMAQSGGYRLDDKNKEQGGEGPGYEIRCECYEPNYRKHFTGSLSMAKKPGLKNSGGSEFFVTLERTDFLDGEHTVFGRVLSGYKVIESLERTHTPGPGGRDRPMEGVIKDKILSAKVLRKRAREYVPVKFDRKQETEAAAVQPSQKPEEKESDESNLSLDPPK
jgi:cyclophilin family peptidyl-prolyl cis-trans isomerase